MRTMLWSAVAAMLLPVVALTDKPDTSRPQWLRALRGDDATKAKDLAKQIEELTTNRKWSEARKSAEKLVAFRADKQGKDHWEVVFARWQVDALTIAEGLPAAKQQAYAEVPALRGQAKAFHEKGRFADSLRVNQKLAAIFRDALGEEHPLTVYCSFNLGTTYYALARYVEAEREHKKALTNFRKTLGEEHPDTGGCYHGLALVYTALSKYALAEENDRKALAILLKTVGEENASTGNNYASLASIWNAQGKYAQAESGYRKALAIHLKVLGEENAHTAATYNGLGANLFAQTKYPEAEKILRRVVAIRLRLLGLEHPDTAIGYNNLAQSLFAQGKFGDAEEGYLKALAIYRKTLGEDHPYVTACHNNLAVNHKEQGRYVEAEEAYRRVLATYRKTLGEEHQYTAVAWNNLAFNQIAQGKYADAEESFRKALAICRKVLGERHPFTLTGRNNVALSQNLQGKFAAAEESYRQALALCLEFHGENHASTAIICNDLARNHESQRRYAEAEAGFRRALEIRRKVLGKEHLHTAMSLNNLGITLRAERKYAEADESLRESLAIQRKILGEIHPTTAKTYANLAFNNRSWGKYAEAEKLASKAADIFARTRLRIASTGLERAAITGETSPLPLLAALLARNGKPAAAWQRLEESLGRGTGDDLAARLRRPADERQRQLRLLKQLSVLDGQLQRLSAIKETNANHEEQRKRLLGAQLRVQDALAKFSHELEAKYGPVAGQVLDRADVQKAIPDHAAFLAWVDIAGEHWAALLRSHGEPVWVHLRGTGEKDSWIKEDEELSWKMKQALTNAAGDWQPLARKLHAQRLAPLAEYLKGVHHLIVLPSEAMDGVPVEVITDGMTVSYALSASLFAYQTQQARTTNTGLVALGDPIFHGPDQPELPLPPGGLLLTAVPPKSPAALAGLKAGDVLLRYGDTALSTLADLQKGMSSADKGASVKVWRLEPGTSRAKELSLRAPAGKLGAVLATEPARQALAAQRRTDKLLAARDAFDWQPLPGTRYEVSALKSLFAANKPTVLLGSNASEPQLAELASKGALGRARYIHLATHGQARQDKPLASRIILSRDHLGPDQRGELSAEQVLTGWNLNADLVTLSACQSGLGQRARGEGFIGFAQALQLAGARSVCLSRWSVNDLSTALLMERFYQNLLGKRSGLKKPMTKARALAEAKEWLRTLPRGEALKRAEAIGAGVERAPGAKELPRIKVRDGTKDEPPYAHPYYWAGFVLVGDPE